MKPTGGPSLGYRPALDGVRGLAILLVMAAHFGVGLPQGGRVGVTMFFALSGYLITALLLNEHASSGRIDLRAFWIRRARRLLPALFALVAAFLLYHAIFGGLRPALSAAFLTVFYLANYAASFGVNLGLLSHTWSLAVEEQFYLWWPVALIALLAWKPTVIGRVVVLLALGIALVKIYSTVTGIGFFFPISRGDALLGGAALAVLGIRGVPWAAPIAIVASILISFVPGNPAWIYYVAAGLGVLVVAGAEGSLLGWSPLVAIGKISYSLYLWHQPAARILRAILPDDLASPIQIASFTVVSFGLALGSYYFIEARFRRPRGASTAAATTEPAPKAEPAPAGDGAAQAPSTVAPPALRSPAELTRPAVALARPSSAPATELTPGPAKPP